MPGWETLVAAAGGFAIGGGLAAIWARQRQARTARERVELETRLRRTVIPVLERRADVLGIPPSERGVDSDGAAALTVTLAQVIKTQEESAELPFGDTVEVDRSSLDPAKKPPNPLETA